MTSNPSREELMTLGDACWCGHNGLAHMGDDAECLACDREGAECRGFRPPPMEEGANDH